MNAKTSQWSFQKRFIFRRERKRIWWRKFVGPDVWKVGLMVIPIHSLDCKWLNTVSPKVMSSKSIFFITFALFSIFAVKSIVIEGRDDYLRTRLKNAVRQIGAVSDKQLMPPFDGDINEMLDVVFSFIQAVVALTTSFPPNPPQLPMQQQSEPGLEPWSEWSPCSKQCGGGMRWRTRNCPGEQPEDIHMEEWETKVRFLFKFAVGLCQKLSQ